MLEWNSYKVYKITVETEQVLSFSTQDFVIEGIELNRYDEVEKYFYESTKTSE
ncbi:9080_t:CDS:2 [Diversispora eburnea]|uniref:9080_t:CDS:1 n=1 Tax=Diversispora eburnea TaxID=1213867 RepID=A0A9N9A0M0_9GLOM|nr:9080_t:CDS:2 [Diversispora eburnea]